MVFEGEVSPSLQPRYTRLTLPPLRESTAREPRSQGHFEDQIIGPFAFNSLQFLLVATV